MASDHAAWPADEADDDPAGGRGHGYDEAVYVISIAAELSGMHPQTLRAYERKGLVDPRRTQGNTRRYSRRDIDRLRLINHLTQERGLNLAGVELVLELGEQLDRTRARVHDLEEALRAMAQRLKDDVEAAHQSHRFEIVPATSRQVELHPRFARQRPRR